ncbi:hypothetical protein RB596_006688 [Gaeumannomyces avenae]
MRHARSSQDTEDCPASPALNTVAQKIKKQTLRIRVEINMSYHPGSAGDYSPQTSQSPSMPERTVCPYEEHVVKDPNVSRITLMIMRDFAHREALYNHAGDERTMFCCPIMRCYEEFDEPMGLVRHLLDCKQLKFGEFNCLRCRTHHRYPITEREWLEFKGWQAEERPCGLKQKLLELSDPIFRAIRTQKRSNASSSHGGSPSATVRSPGPPSDWHWSEIGYQPCYPQSSSGSFTTSQNGSSRSGSSSQDIFNIPGAFWESSASSIGTSLHVNAPEIQIPAQAGLVRYLDDLSQSPESMGAGQAGGQPVWASTPTTGHTETAASGITAFLPTPDSRGMAANCFPMPVIKGPLASHESHSWNPQDDSQLCYLQQQMPPPLIAAPVELHPDSMPQEVPAANSGALHPCLEIPDRVPAYELPGQVVVCQLNDDGPAHELECGGRRSDYTCEICAWQPEKDGKRANFGSYLRKHKQIHLGLKFPCPNIGCKRSYSRPDNLSKHIKESHPGSNGAHGSPSSSQTRSTNRRRFTSSSTR